MRLGEKRRKKAEKRRKRERRSGQRSGGKERERMGGQRSGQRSGGKKPGMKVWIHFLNIQDRNLITPQIVIERPLHHVAFKGLDLFPQEDKKKKISSKKKQEPERKALNKTRTISPVCFFLRIKSTWKVFLSA